MADTPIINGHKYGWASVEAHANGVVMREFTELSYSSKNDPGKARGTGIRVLGTTRGEADHEGSFSMLKAQANAFQKSLGAGFMMKKFGITVSYSEDGEGGVVTDKLLGCRITSREDSPKVGNEPLSVKFDLHIMQITYDNVDPFEDQK